MIPERWRRIESVYYDALELEPARRAQFLDEACAGDEDLRLSVVELLEAQEDAPDFLAQPALELAARATVAESPESMLGRHISHYKILSLLGAGGMGEVYLAQDVRLDRTVALKMLPLHLTSDQDRLRRFLREARAASAFNHENVAAIYDIGEGEGRRFIAMEYVNGETLAARIGGRPLDEKEIISIAMQGADALAEAHSKGIIHRDIKSANLMITPRGQLKVLDFGLAKITNAEGRVRDSLTMDNRTQPGGLMGTVQYMSPEQVRGMDVDERSDIFSLGVVLYEMATGHVPFAGATIGDTTDRILHAEPDALPDTVSSDLARVIGLCLAKDREQRYKSARDLWTDLKTLQGGSTLAIAGTDDLRKRSRRFHINRQSLVRVAGILAIAAIAVVVFLKARAPVLTFDTRDWVLVADVENQTGDLVFDKSLQTAFTVGLEQSRFANVLPRSRITAALKRMKKNGTESLDEPLARELATREGVRAVILASIVQVGNSYQLAVRIQNPASGTNVWSDQTIVSGKQKVLGGVDNLVAKVRAALGESLSAIAATSKPLAQATTASIEALREFSMAVEKHRAANFAEAKTYYENAIRIDPTFTTAKGQLGILNFEFFDRNEGKRLLSEAIQDVENLTDMEKYGILAFHARAVENDIPKTIQFYKLLLALHPDVQSVRNNLGWNYYQMGRGQEAAAEYKEAVRLDPYMMLTYNGFTMTYLFQLGDPDSALELIKKQLSYDTRQAFPYQNMGWAYLAKDNLNAAEQALKQSLELEEKATDTRYLLGHTYFLQGRYRDAVDMYSSVSRFDSNEDEGYYFTGLSCHLSADRNCEERNFSKYVDVINARIRKNPNNAEYRFDLANVYARLGRSAGAQNSAAAGMKLDPAAHFRMAQFLNLQGRSNDAIDEFERAIQNGYRNFIWMKIHPDLQNLRNVPRFRDLLKANLK